ncbi:MAG: hypothetical protein J4415_03410, partial [Candidatus Diapherotrites archaeon]|nr:hypothetical protein [Candidatus Diapherotrites archaeon]
NFYTFYTNLKEAARPENHHPVIPDISAFSKFNFCVNGIKECYIEQLTTDNYELHKYIGSASRTIIRNKSSGNDAFLRNLYITGKLTFKIGIRNRPELSEKEKKIVLEKGAENTGLLPDGYDGYYPPTEKDAKDPNKHYFYPENIEFSPYLMHDGYSSDFKDDFKAAYENKINNKWKAGFSTQWNFKTKDGGALVIDKPALYSVFVDYEWEDAEKPNITVSVDTGKPAEELSETMRQNIFFYLPIDGLVGKENGQYNRTGYGTTWGPNVPADVPSVCGTSPPAGSACHTDVTGTDTGAEAKTEEKTTFFEDIVGIAPSSVNEGAEIFTVTSDIKYKAAQQGIVLSIDRSKGIYKSTMVNAVPVRLKIIKNSLDRGAGLFYELYTNSPNETTKIIAPG